MGGCPSRQVRPGTRQGLLAGIGRFESSIGGLGGALGSVANGNADTEALAAMLHGMGIQTGVDLSRLRAATVPILTFLDRLPGNGRRSS